VIEYGGRLSRSEVSVHTVNGYVGSWPRSEVSVLTVIEYGGSLSRREVSVHTVNE